MIELETVERNTVLNRSKIEYVDWGLNTFVGCGHSCTYCYARMIDMRFKKVKDAADWHRPKLIKNYMELLEKKIHLVDSHEEVFVSTMTDVYAADIHNLGVARKVIKRLQDSNIKYRLLTKSPKVTQDIDILEGYSRGLVGLSITTDKYNYNGWKRYEPRTKPIDARLDALLLLGKHDIDLWVSAEPFLPGTIIGQYFANIFSSVNATISGKPLQEIVVGKMNYQAGVDKLFNWSDVVASIETYRAIHSNVKWHYKKEFANFLLKKYPELEPKGGFS